MPVSGSRLTLLPLAPAVCARIDRTQALPVCGRRCALSTERKFCCRNPLARDFFSLFFWRPRDAWRSAAGPVWLLVNARPCSSKLVPAWTFTSCLPPFSTSVFLFLTNKEAQLLPCSSRTETSRLVAGLLLKLFGWGLIPFPMQECSRKPAAGTRATRRRRPRTTPRVPFFVSSLWWFRRRQRQEENAIRRGVRADDTKTWLSTAPRV